MSVLRISADIHSGVRWTEAVKNFLKSSEDEPKSILLGKGTYSILNMNYLIFSSAISIVGDPGVKKEDIVIVGGIKFMKGIKGICHLKNLTLRKAKYSGVLGQSSFTMDDVIVEQCKFSGVEVWGETTSVQCTNVEVRHCGWSGVLADDGGSITLTGDKTTVHHNSTMEADDEYGLKVNNPSATIQLVSPLTKERVSVNNGGGGNWGANGGAAMNQIISANCGVEECKPLDHAANRHRVVKTQLLVPEDCKTLK